MSHFQIEGGRRLSGTLGVQGAKNSVLPILAAALLVPGKCLIRNCPDLSDVTDTLEILKLLGCRVCREGDTVRVDAEGLKRDTIPGCLMRKMRSSVIFLGPLLARRGRACLSLPGGCELGPRPIDLHLSALRTLGVEIGEEQGNICCRADGLRGREICLPIPSVGATENAMLCACGCEGVTTIVGAAREPEIVDLQNFLRAMGADVSGAGESLLTVRGGRPLHGGEYTVMGDRIAAATYLCAAAAAGGEITLTGVEPAHLSAVLRSLEQAGCVLTEGDGRIGLRSCGSLHGVPPVRTAPYPGFPTDAQAILMAALAGGRGCTMFVENMFESRYGHVDELRRMGADIQTSGRVAVVTGAGVLRGTQVRGCDLRCGAALVVAGLAARGRTCVGGLRHIRRGYEDLAGNLRLLGADIREID